MRVTEAGVELDADFDVEVEVAGERVRITMSSHSGSSGGRPGRNSQYSDALRVILERLGDLDARIVDALVVSSAALRDYPGEDQRRFGGPFPIRIGDHDPGELRTRLTEAMRSVARKPELGPGGNNRRRVTLYVDAATDLAGLPAVLSSGARPRTDSARQRPAAPASGGGVPLTAGDGGQRHARAQGYVADAAYHRAVELHAMDVATGHFVGWEVEDTSAGNPYDLVVRRGGQRRFVEVKGTAGTGEQIHLTEREVDHVRRHPGEVVLFVVHSIAVDREDPASPRASGGVVRIVDPFDLDAGQLRPTAHTWKLPRA